jgi:hypothetical protein
MVIVTEESPMALSPEGMHDAVIRNLGNRTGKTLEQWVRLASKTRLTEQEDLRRWLKEEHGLGSSTCYIIADATLGAPGGKRPTGSELLDAQYASGKDHLRPVYDRLVREIRKIGTDVTIGVRKTQTTFARRHTFAIAKAPTRTRIDLGLRLPGVRPTRRLKATTAFSDNATHCVELTAPGKVDAELGRWLRAAYALRG